ncbi:MAG: HAMP domain-containing histidine kinase, partial [Rhodomicrobium sp.]|nr:HAMP domain-containing histidine kinase [Rhodomicrobium sp.]
MASENEAAALLSLGDFLTTEEPVWVWDAAACRILWANTAGRAFWGASSLDALQARRFSARSKSIKRLNDLAAETGGQARERLETLEFAGSSGRRPVRCYVQSLEVAGGRPGLIVKALPEGAGTRDASALSPAKDDAPTVAPAAEKTPNPDQAALDAIARRLKKGPRVRKAHAALPEAAPVLAMEAGPALPTAFDLKIRELCHELRNAMTVILGFAERIKDGIPAGKRPEQLSGYADNILESAQLAMAILGDFSNRLLNAEETRPDAGPAEIRPAVESALRLIAPLAKQAGNQGLARRAGGFR